MGRVIYFQKREKEYRHVRLIKGGEIMAGDKKHGSLLWLIFWIIVCFPIAIIYALIRSWG